MLDAVVLSADGKQRLDGQRLNGCRRCGQLLASRLRQSSWHKARPI